MPDAFSSDTPLVPAEAASQDLLRAAAPVFDLDSLIPIFIKHGYSKICLQFPDDLLPFSVDIYNFLKDRLPSHVNLFILADTTFGACCVDFISAKHVEAEIVVHFGPACLSPINSPVIYLFEDKPVDTHIFVDSVSREIEKNVDTRSDWIIICDVSYHCNISHLSTSLSHALPDINLHETAIRKICIEGSDPSTEVSNGLKISNRFLNLPDGTRISDCNIIYVGEENLYLNNLVLTNPKAIILKFDPMQNRCSDMSGSSSRQLMKRFSVVQKAKDADVFGLVVGTLGISLYAPLIKYIRDILRAAGKKSYTLAVGKLNPNKLANFPEIECFILIACPENTLIDSKEFLQPIATPYELQLALGKREWDGSYDLDFKSILDAPHMEKLKMSDQSDSDGDRPHFSLITGKYKYSKKFGRNQEETVVDEKTGELTTRNTDQALSVIEDSAGGLYLSRKTFKGLESRIGMDEPSILTQGRSGVARGYTIIDEQNRGAEDLSKRSDSKTTSL